MAAAHHRADATEQQRPTDRAGRRGSRSSQERSTAAAHRGRGRAIGGSLTIRGLIILAGRLRLLHYLAPVPYRPAGTFGRPDVRYRSVRLTLAEYRFAHRIEEPAAGLVLRRRAGGLEFLNSVFVAL